MPCDYSKYPEKWHSEIRPRILERAENKCEECGVKNHELILRGYWNDSDGNEIEVYQDMDGWIYDASNSKKIGGAYVGEVDPDNKNKLLKVVLTIAHLDHDETNHNVKDERLKALCQLHHLRYDAPEKARRRKEKKYKYSLFPLKTK